MDVRLHYIDSSVEEILEAPARIFMFAGCDHDWMAALLDQLAIASVVVRGQALLDPTEIVGPERFDQSKCVGRGKCHPAIEREEEVLATCVPHLRGKLDILAQTLVAVGGPVWERQLATNEAHFLRQIRTR